MSLFWTIFWAIIAAFFAIAIITWLIGIFLVSVFGKKISNVVDKNMGGKTKTS